MNDTPMTDTPPPLRQRSETEQRLLAAARNLATEGGYDAVTIQAVADLAGVSRVTAYKYFRNKDHLLSDLVFGWSETVVAALDAAGIDGNTPAERVAARLCFVVEQLRQEPKLLSAVLAASASPGGRGSETSSKVIQRYLGIDLGAHDQEESMTLVRVFGCYLQSLLLSLSAGRLGQAEAAHDIRYLTRKILGD